MIDNSLIKVEEGTTDPKTYSGSISLTSVEINEVAEEKPLGLSASLLVIGTGSLSLNTVTISKITSSPASGVITAKLSAAGQITIQGTNTITDCKSALGIFAFSVEEGSDKGSITIEGTVTYMKDETEVYETRRIAKGSKAENIVGPEKTGYNFKYW